MFLLMTLPTNLITQKTENAEELIVKIASGDNDAFKLFYETTKADVYSFALSLLRNVHDAEDVMQSVYIKVYNSAKSYKPQGKPMAWVLTITKNLCHDKLRSISKQADFTNADENNISLSNNIDADDKLLLEYCLKSLNEDERNIVVLHTVSGLRHREIASLLDLPLGTVLSKYNRALAKLKNFLKAGEYND